MDKGAVVDAKDVKGLTPLHYAVKREHEDCIEYLLEKGKFPAKINFPPNFRNFT